MPELFAQSVPSDGDSHSSYTPWSTSLSLGRSWRCSFGSDEWSHFCYSFSMHCSDKLRLYFHIESSLNSDFVSLLLCVRRKTDCSKAEAVASLVIDQQSREEHSFVFHFRGC
jgi:hypothetical protein